MTDGLSAIFLAGSFVALWVSALGLVWTPGSALQGSPAGGLLSSWNRLAEVMGESAYLILPRFKGGMGAGGEYLPQGTFLTLAGLFLALLFYFMVRSRVRLWLLLPVILWIVPLFALDMAPEIPAALCFVAALGLAWVSMGRESREWTTALCGLAVVLAVSLGTGVLLQETGAGVPETLTKKTGEAVERLLHLRYGSGALKNGALSELDGKTLAAARGALSIRKQVLQQGSKDPTKTGLEVQAAEPFPCYLRGFVGETYKGDRWIPLSNTLYYKEREELYWLNRKGFDGLSQKESTVALTGEENPGKQMKVKVVHGDRSLFYAPYELKDTAVQLPEGSRNHGGAFLSASGLLGRKEYTLTLGKSLTGSWTEQVGRLYEAEASQALTDYFTCESHYNVWCYQHDTDLSGKLRKRLEEEVGDPGDLSGNHADYKEAIRKVRSYLQENFVYSDHFRPLKEKEDFLEAFLKARKGCDVHYASLATALFRLYGIPARYVEGYLLTPGDAGKGKAALGQSHQHAWTEIYIDGYGWVPLEVTPEYMGIMPEADMSKGLQAIAYETKLNESPSSTPEEETEETEPDYTKLLLKILLLAGMALLALVVLYLLYRLGRRAWRSYGRHRAFTDPDPRYGICAIYGHMLKTGLPVSERARVVGEAAAFSLLTVTEDHRQLMRRELARSREKKRKGGSV